MDILTLHRIVSEEFPYSKPFEGQIDTIVKIVDNFVNKDRKHVILDAPTGSGKSVIAYTTIKVLQRIQFINRAQIITATKALQDSYSENFPEIYQLKSKTNYDCAGGDAGYYSTPECIAKLRNNLCSTSRCPYVVRREYWCDKAKIRNTNTAFMLESCASLVQHKGRFVPFMVIDECHSLEKMLLDHARFIFSKDSIVEFKKLHLGVEEACIEFIKLYRDFDMFIVNLLDDDNSTKIDLNIKDYFRTFCLLLDTINSFISEYRQDLLGGSHKEDQRLADILMPIMESTSDMLYFSEILATCPLNAVIHVENTKDGLSIKLIDAKILAPRALFDKSKYFLHMSGTVCGYHYHVEKLGINPASAAYVYTSNNIPAKNRSINIVNLPKIYSNTYEAVKNHIPVIDKLVNYYKDYHGFIYCPSFELCQIFVDYCQTRDRMVIPANIEEAKEIMTRSNNKVIVTPSIVEGIDFRDDQCRFQIIPRIPYLYLGDPIVKIKNRIEPEYYWRTTIMMLVQVLGRSIRSPEDWAHSYLLDDTFQTLIRKNREYFPSWIFEAINT
jgi:Rad3-related DNA helicase